MNRSESLTQSRSFGMSDYWRMYKAKGIRLPIEYFLQIHVFDLWNGTDTHLPTCRGEDELAPRASNVDYRPCRCSWTSEIKSVFDMLASRLGAEFNEYTFIDIRCGKGKAALAWSQFLARADMHQRVIGIDLDHRCIRVAKANRRIAGITENLAFKQADAGHFDYAHTGSRLICYLYNRFDAATLRRILRMLEAVEAIIIYNNPVDLETIREFGYETILEKIGWHPNKRSVVLRKRRWAVADAAAVSHCGTSINVRTAGMPVSTGDLDASGKHDEMTGAEKKIAMMQPYLFPYLGYFQLIAAADEFVIADDLQYVKETWINRNRILLNGKDRMITFPLKKDSYLLEINQRYMSANIHDELEAMLRVLSAAYRKAPCFGQVFPVIEDILRSGEKNLAKFATYSLRRLCDYMQIRTPFVIASDLQIEKRLEKHERIIVIQKKLGGNIYINLIGGTRIYFPERFRAHGIALRFHCMDDIRYKQFGHEFVPLLSIIDVLMFNDVEEMQRLLRRYSLIEHPGPSA